MKRYMIIILTMIFTLSSFAMAGKVSNSKSKAKKSSTHVLRKVILN